MAKIMLVEDDKSLREIYGVRLLAEGYDIVTAGDGEEALAMAIKERPSLILTDVMMPKISGFDMIDILRSTTETRNIKVIVMTALGSSDQRMRGEQLGADRYLVKSQVGIEDVVKAVHEVLEGGNSNNTPQQQQTPPQTGPQQPERPVAPNVPSRPAPPPASATTQTTPRQTPPVTQSTVPQNQAVKQRVISPISDPSQQVDINALLDKEMAREAGVDNITPVPSAEQERSEIEKQLESFENAPVPPVEPQSQPQAAPEPPSPQTQQPPTMPERTQNPVARPPQQYQEQPQQQQPTPQQISRPNPQAGVGQEISAPPRNNIQVQ